jgi:hypothetical protein
MQSSFCIVARSFPVSNEKVKTSLEGYRGPYFPPPLKRIQKRYGYNHARWNKLLFDDIADVLHDGTLTGCPVTDDDYVWPFGIRFTINEVRYIVLFPATHDGPEKVDGTYSDRHVALYVADDAPENLSSDQRAYVAQIFVNDAITAYRHLYSDAIRDEKMAAAAKSQPDS